MYLVCLCVYCMCVVSVNDCDGFVFVCEFVVVMCVGNVSVVKFRY